MARKMSAEAIARGTGRSWDEWLEYFASVRADELTHQEVVAKAAAFGAPPWWQQMVTIAYEQHIGRRVVGERVAGGFAVSASRTLEGSMDEVLARWRSEMDGREAFDGVARARPPEVTSTAKWRYWRCALVDESRIVANVSAKPPGRSVLSVQHEALESADRVEHWRGYWRQVLREL